MILKGVKMGESVDQEIPKFFNKRFLEWQMGVEERKTQTEFAEYLGVASGTLGHWMNGIRKPDYNNAKLISKKLGPEIFDICGFLRPDPQLRRVVSLWHKIGERGKGIILRTVMEATNQNVAEQTNQGSEPSIPDEELASIEQRTARKDSTDSLSE